MHSEACEHDPIAAAKWRSPQDESSRQRFVIDARGAEIAPLEAQKDQSVYKLYHLSDDETQVIEDRNL